MSNGIRLIECNGGYFRMLNRQKALLFLLTCAARPVSKMELTKWAFIVREETPSQGGSAFYDFLPYKYGPFSFCLYREMDGLIRDGYVKAEKHWSATSLAAGVVKSLPDALRRAGQQVIERVSR